MLKSGVKSALKSAIRTYLGDELVVSRQYRDIFKKNINLLSPTTFNEKLQFQKLYNRDSRMTNLCDKYRVREYIESLGYGNLLNEVISVHDRPEEIDFDALPEQFVIKCNHASETNILCRNKSTLDRQDTLAKLRLWLGENHYDRCREWCYRDVDKKIIVEKYLGDQLQDFKFFCFSAQPKFVLVDTDRFANHLRDIYDVDWNRLDLRYGRYPNKPVPDSKPEFFDDMVSAAARISAPFNFCRVDFLVSPDRFYFGEMTFYPGAGLDKFEPEAFDRTFGRCMDIGAIKVPPAAKVKLRVLTTLNKVGVG